MSKLGDKLFREEVPPAHRRSVLDAARAEMHKETAAASWLSSLFRPAVGLSFAAAAVAFVLVFRMQTELPGRVAFRPDPEMVRDAEMLYDLKVLKKLDVLEKVSKGKWPRPKS